MKITALVENRSSCDLTPVHGLSLYIETERHKLLFDLGPDGTLLKNAEKRGIDLGQVDAAVISHGHFDHGGALAAFLKVNHTAKVYIQRRAFEKHFSKSLGFVKVPVGRRVSYRRGAAAVYGAGYLPVLLHSQRYAV